MRNLHISTLFILIFLAIGCQKEIAEPTVIPQTAELPANFDESNYYVPNFEGVTERSNCPWTVLDAGSTDALAAAIANTCDGGVIYLKAGVHTENKSVLVNKRVIIMGEQGAILKITAPLAPYDADAGYVVVDPGLHLLNAGGTLIQNVEIQPTTPDGGTAILIENSHQAAVIRCVIPSFQFAVLVENSDRVAIMHNKIVATSKWQTGEVGDAEPITIVNGKSAYISDNDVSNALFGIWACGSWGTCERNNTHGGYLGIILCNVPPYLKMPSGVITGSKVPGTGWKVQNNKSHDNANVGYLVIDGANNNWLYNNEGGNNGDYDMELTSDSQRFGFLTPESYENTVNTGSYNLSIKDCGTRNHITGGTMIDTASDPCN